MNPQEIIIKPSRKKEIALIFKCLLCLLFVITGIFIIVIPEQPNELLGNATIRRIIGVIGILFFGLILTLSIVKLSSSKKYGIKISNEGTYDNSKAGDSNFIKWKHIVAVEKTKFYGQKYIQVIVNNPKYYIDNQKNIFYKKILESNYKLCDTPILISNI